MRCRGFAYAAVRTGVRHSTHGDWTTGRRVVETRFIGGLNLSPIQTVSRPLIELHSTSYVLTFWVPFGLSSAESGNRGLSTVEKWPASESLSAW